MSFKTLEGDPIVSVLLVMTRTILFVNDCYASPSTDGYYAPQL